MMGSQIVMGGGQRVRNPTKCDSCGDSCSLENDVPLIAKTPKNGFISQRLHSVYHNLITLRIGVIIGVIHN